MAEKSNDRHPLHHADHKVSQQTSTDQGWSTLGRSERETPAREARIMDFHRKETLARAQQDYALFQADGTIPFPRWLYGEPLGSIVNLKCLDFPQPGVQANLEFDSSRAALLSIGFQTDFIGHRGYADVKGHPVSEAWSAVESIKKVFDAIRTSDVRILHVRQGFLPDLSDCPYSKIVRSKIAGTGRGIGEKPEHGLGFTLLRGSPGWQFIAGLEPEEGELICDLTTPAAALQSSLFLQLRNLGITHLIFAGAEDQGTTSLMAQAADLGFWCVLLEDAMGAADDSRHEASVLRANDPTHGFGWVSNSEQLIQSLNKAGYPRH